ncbi:TIGR03560 family F420-dependent LLM class oxidoreductase [Chloroflexi bacterium TSY]|nr:TIGR03560 family F420-dependent LLM class oxidoreductase [Chloroflexi bacterium TSY]
MPKLTFGIKTAPQYTTYQEMLAVWKQADQEPLFDHAWLFDHYAPIFGNIDAPCLEGWTLLSAFAAETERIRIGIMVTGNTYRHPAVLASIAATVDIISQGRLDFGIGAGWNEYEHNSMGIPLYRPGERIRRLDEACTLIKLLFTQHTTDFDGRYYQLKEARREPKPVQKPYPPFVIGGSGEKLTLRVVAKHADVWNYVDGPIEDFKRKVDILHSHCESVERNPEEIALSIQVRPTYDNLAAAAERTQTFMEAGASHFVYTLSPPFPDNVVQLLAEQVLGQVSR